MNRTILIGNIVRDPELRHTQTGKAVASFTLAINEFNDHVEYVDCVAWDKQAQNLAQYCGKGSKVAVEGRIRKRDYQAQDGSKRYVTEVIANSIEFLITKREQVQSDYQQQGYTPPYKAGANDFYETNSDVDILEDDLPF